MIIRTRFAPSPSGNLHVGGARTALFCWAFARQRGGKFVLRIEDTDQRRSSDAASLGFLRDLKWLGIDWDEGPEFEGCGGGEYGPYFQSQRVAIYEKYLRQLIESGRAYYAFDTPEELDSRRQAARKANENYRYDRDEALAIPREERKRRADAGEPCVVRFMITDQDVTIHDEVLGDATVPNKQLDDFVIWKADGFPTYHFAVVVDDELMQITHVIRAQEHFNNTAKHMLLQDALGFRRPVYAHLPLIFNPDGTKMSKRDKDKTLRRAIRERGIEKSPIASVDAATFTKWLKDKNQQLELEDVEALAKAAGVHLPEINVQDFVRSGYLPSALCNFLALNGWNPGENIEKFDNAFLAEHFDFGRVMKSPAKFDREKLLAFNHDAIQALSSAEFVRLFRAHCTNEHPEFVEALNDAQLSLLAAANQKRSKTLDDQVESSRFFIVDDGQIVYEESKEVHKALDKGEPTGIEHMENVRAVLEGVEDWTVASLEKVVGRYVEQFAGGNLGKVAQPLRIAVSGTTISPAIFETLVILGKQRTLSRIARCVAWRQKVGMQT